MRGAIIAGGSIPTTPGGLMHLRATCSASCALPGRDENRTRDRDFGVFRGP